MKILLGDFSATVDREDIFEPTIGNEILPHLKISLSRVQCSHIATFMNVIGRLQMGKPTIRLTIFL
jgi:hypothetical protein